MKNKTIVVQGTAITIATRHAQDYISLTDMLKAKDGDFFISDWLRNRNTVEFLGVWERIYNPTFNDGEFAIIKSQVGLNSYKLSVKEWVEKTSAIGLRATTGRYGGTYAHKDIAFEFGMWISAEFKIYLIREFQRLKDEESRTTSLEWSFQRTMAPGQLQDSHRCHQSAADPAAHHARTDRDHLRQRGRLAQRGAVRHHGSPVAASQPRAQRQHA
jgi:KilA-N domain